MVFPFGGAYAIYGDLTNPVYKEWDDRDLRKQLWSPVEFGLGTNTLVCTKFIDKNAISKAGGANDDPVYGYSDLLLIYAEALVMENGKVTAEALEAVNQIRRRAYGRNTMVASEFDYKQSDCPSVSALLDLIMKERGYEFQVEGKRWLELKRTGKAAEIIKATKGLDIDV
ncbi:RagB/SusD family nutrient uptake outer membrane protein [Parabacteroides sp.]